MVNPLYNLQFEKYQQLKFERQAAIKRKAVLEQKKKQAAAQLARQSDMAKTTESPTKGGNSLASTMMLGLGGIDNL